MELQYNWWDNKMAKKRPEWLMSILLEVGDIFGAALWDAMYKTEELYSRATLFQIQTLEEIYKAQTQQEVIIGMVRESASRAGMQLKGYAITQSLPGIEAIALPKNDPVEPERHTEEIVVRDINLRDLIEQIRGE
jgi:hypothetical protein